MKCQECGKQIDKDYLPSNFCEDCVEAYMNKISNRFEERTKYFEKE